MPATISLLLMLATALLHGAGAGRGHESGPVPTLDARGPSTTIEAHPTRAEGPWRISEADTDEVDEDDGDHLGTAGDDPFSRRPSRGVGAVLAIRRDRGILRPAARSPILRC